MTENRQWLYCAWFQNSLLDPNDQDYQWPACILVESEDAIKALSWGDHLVRRYSIVNPNELFIKSNIEPADLNVINDDYLPKIIYGQEATDKEIGW